MKYVIVTSLLALSVSAFANGQTATTPPTGQVVRSDAVTEPCDGSVDGSSGTKTVTTGTATTPAAGAGSAQGNK